MRESIGEEANRREVRGRLILRGKSCDASLIASAERIVRPQISFNFLLICQIIHEYGIFASSLPLSLFSWSVSIPVSLDLSRSLSVPRSPSPSLPRTDVPRKWPMTHRGLTQGFGKWVNTFHECLTDEGACV